MAKRRAKKTAKQPDLKKPPEECKEDAFADQEVERQSIAIRTIRDVEIERLLTGVRLLRSNFSKEQLQTPALQFFKENLPNLAIIENGKDGQYEVQWKNTDGKAPTNTGDGGNIHTSLLHRMSIAYPDCSAAMPSLVQTSLYGADNLQVGDFVFEEPSDTHMFGLQDSLRTPGVSSQRLSVGMTPKTLRLPKNGEMLLSVHGSPLGVYKEENMEAINEAEDE